MAPPPAVVIVVRHGARLDAADKQWHLKSPTPYDPPLTYGGWTQCRNLGNRIAALLQTREQIFNAAAQEEEANGTNGTASYRTKSGKQRRKKHRVIIHSSPFLRCVQTSIAISSGMSQYNGLNGQSKFERGPPASRSRGEPSQERPARPLSTISDEDGDLPRGRPTSSQSSNTRIKLRVDAFLGEWLSPEYFESITAPPDSVLMLASAKAELLHRGEPISAEERNPRAPMRKNSTAGLWGSPISTATELSNSDLAIEDGLELDSPAHPMPRNRATSHSGDDREPTSPRLSMRGSFTRKNGYHPPTPLYSVSPQDPIPPGYVAHARDHCVEVDLHWDSMRAPQNWGDGGKYGEEWSAMHKRFRHGLDSMVNWYRHHVESPHQRWGHLRTLHPPSPHEDEDEDTDTVVVLVSHGAGCNALIGALTNQPVLLDIGMGSLTMAVRRERPLSPPPPMSPSGRRSSESADHQLAQEYEVALTASTDHLRGSNASSQASSPIDVAHPPSLKSLAPGLLQRSNTLPLRPVNTPPPPRHISPAPSKIRSTSLSKMSFASSPLNPNPPGATPPLPARTWMEAHQNPVPAAKTWMERHAASEAVKSPPAALTPSAVQPPKPLNSDSSQQGSGLWQAKSAATGPGLWSRPSTIPQSGPGSAAIADAKAKQIASVQNKAAFVSPGAPTADDHRLEQWMSEREPQRNGVHKGTNGRDGVKSVHFAELPKKTDGEDEVSPHTKDSALINGESSGSEDEHNEEFSRWHDEVRAGEHAPRIYKTSSDIRLNELGMKRRWTMNDERNLEREKDGDWRLEAWM